MKALGFDPGGADGMLGPMTIAAVKRYEAARGWAVSGEVDWLLLQSLRAGKDALGSAATRPAESSPSAPSAPVTIVPSEDMRLASRVIKEAGHPCGSVGVAVRLSDGSVRAICTNNEIYRVFRVGGEWAALKCSAAQRLGVQGC